MRFLENLKQFMRRTKNFRPSRQLRPRVVGYGLGPMDMMRQRLLARALGFCGRMKVGSGLRYWAGGLI